MEQCCSTLLNNSLTIAPVISQVSLIMRQPYKKIIIIKITISGQFQILNGDLYTFLPSKTQYTEE